MENFYELLGVSPLASPSELETAFRRAAQRQKLDLAVLQRIRQTLFTDAKQAYDRALYAAYPEYFQAARAAKKQAQALQQQRIEQALQQKRRRRYLLAAKLAAVLLAVAAAVYYWRAGALPPIREVRLSEAFKQAVLKLPPHENISDFDEQRGLLLTERLNVLSNTGTPETYRHAGAIGQIKAHYQNTDSGSGAVHNPLLNRNIQSSFLALDGILVGKDVWRIDENGKAVFSHQLKPFNVSRAFVLPKRRLVAQFEQAGRGLSLRFHDTESRWQQAFPLLKDVGSESYIGDLVPKLYFGADERYVMMMDIAAGNSAYVWRLEKNEKGEITNVVSEGEIPCYCVPDSEGNVSMHTYLDAYIDAERDVMTMLVNDGTWLRVSLPSLRVKTLGKTDVTGISRAALSGQGQIAWLWSRRYQDVSDAVYTANLKEKRSKLLATTTRGTESGGNYVPTLYPLGSHALWLRDNNNGKVQILSR